VGAVIVPPNKEPPQATPVVVGAHKGPGGTWIPDPIDATERDQVVAGTRELFVGGVVRYDDPYGTGRETRWCTMWHRVSHDFIPCRPGVGTTYMR
jgi:hypothetical protein